MNIIELKIEIDEKDPKKYADVAFLVDRSNFLLDLSLLREKWKIKKLIKKGKASDWLYNLFNKNIGKYKEFMTDIRYLLHKYHRHKGFLKVVVQALLTGRVDKSSYSHTWTEMMPLELDKNDDFMSYESPKISVTRQTTEADLKKAFDEIQNYLSKKPESVNDKYFDRYYKKSKGIEAIKDDRNTYWQYLREKDNGRGAYKRLVDYMYKKTRVNYDERALRKIVQRYKEALQM